MSIGLNVVIVLLVSFVLSNVSAQTCPVFDQIQESQYDRTYPSMIDANARPLGFLRATQFFSSSSGDTTPCFSASGLNNARQVEVMYETFPPSNLCLRIKNGDPDDDFGCHEKLQACRHAKTSTTEFEFYCAQSKGCFESDVNFWLRITTGPIPANDTEGMWCQWRSNKYPGSLAKIPIFLTPPTTKDSTLGASNLSVSGVLLVILASIAWFTPFYS